MSSMAATLEATTAKHEVPFCLFVGRQYRVFSLNGLLSTPGRLDSRDIHAQRTITGDATGESRR